VTSPQSAFQTGTLLKSAVALVLALLVGAAPPLRAEPVSEKIEVGRSALVINQVIGKFGEAEPAPINLDDQVLFNEDISTGAAAKTVVRFRDGSTFAMGPDAVARIDSFVFNPEESVSHKTVTVTQGVFRYISGIAAKDQNTEIKITSGTMSIRGSVVSGVVTPGVPPLLFVAEGSASFTNASGSSDVAAGQGIAVPSASTPPMNPANLPPAVIAQALSVIEPLLPPPQTQSSLTPPNIQILGQQGRLNLVPVATQQALQAGAAAPPPLRGNSPATTLSRALPLLNQANTVGLLNASQSSPTPQQQAFLNQVNQAANQALAQLNEAVNTATNAHSATATSAIASVGQGLNAAGQQTAVSGRSSGPGPTPTNVAPTVLSVSEANPVMSEAALRTALNALGSGTAAAAALIRTFAQDISSVADCDETAGRQMAAALQSVLSDPQYSNLTNSLSAVGVTLSMIGTPVTAQTTPTFGNFGSNANTGASTSPTR
jgi:hypothetical protein